MRTTATIFQAIIGIGGAIQIILGLIIWPGNADRLIAIHMLVGIILVLSLWTVAILGALVGVNPGLVILAIVWGLITPILGIAQANILPDNGHWLIQVLHLLIGLGVIGQGQNLARLIKAQSRGRQALQS